MQHMLEDQLREREVIAQERQADALEKIAVAVVAGADLDEGWVDRQLARRRRRLTADEPEARD